MTAQRRPLRSFGRVFFTKSETRWPLTPWPSQTPKSQSPSTPARFLTEMKLSWLGLTWEGMKPCLVLIEKQSTILCGGYRGILFY